MTADPYKWRRRLGRFVLGRQAFEDGGEALEKLIQAKVIIKHIERDWGSDRVVYVAQGDVFEIVEEGNAAPLYLTILHQKHMPGGLEVVDVTWELAMDPYTTIEYRVLSA